MSLQIRIDRFMLEAVTHAQTRGTANVMARRELEAEALELIAAVNEVMYGDGRETMRVRVAKNMVRLAIWGAP